jgi:hypothetical protein
VLTKVFVGSQFWILETHFLALLKFWGVTWCVEEVHVFIGARVSISNPNFGGVRPF